MTSTNVTSTQFSKIVRGEVKKWPDGRNIVLVLHKDSAGENETLEHLNKMSANEWNTFLLSHKDSIVFVDTDADVLKEVQTEPGAVGLIEVHSIDNSCERHSGRWQTADGVRISASLKGTPSVISLCQILTPRPTTETTDDEGAFNGLSRQPDLRNR